MRLLFLIRHGHNEYVGKGKLAGRMPGVHLSELGERQAVALAGLLKPVRLQAIYASPLERTMETAGPIAVAQGKDVQPLPGLLEIDYGRWQGASLKALQRRKLWPVIQNRPSLARFPGGESFAEAQARVVAALDELLTRHPGSKTDAAAVFHSDPIKLALSHFLGLPLDMFQRLTIDPASISVLAFSGHSVRLLKMNDNRATHPEESG
jgi:probable phosphoglycerate mutase